MHKNTRARVQMTQHVHRRSTSSLRTFLTRHRNAQGDQAMSKTTKIARRRGEERTCNVPTLSGFSVANYVHVRDGFGSHVSSTRKSNVARVLMIARWRSNFLHLFTALERRHWIVRAVKTNKTEDIRQLDLWVKKKHPTLFPKFPTPKERVLDGQRSGKRQCVAVCGYLMYAYRAMGGWALIFLASFPPPECRPKTRLPSSGSPPLLPELALATSRKRKSDALFLSLPAGLRSNEGC